MELQTRSIRDDRSARYSANSAGDSILGVHIHIEGDRIIIDGSVRTDEVKESVLKACRSLGGNRQVVDQMQIEQPLAVS